jgi:hypothetical protein
MSPERGRCSHRGLDNRTDIWVGYGTDVPAHGCRTGLAERSFGFGHLRGAKSIEMQRPFESSPAGREALGPRADLGTDSLLLHAKEPSIGSTASAN